MNKINRLLGGGDDTIYDASEDIVNTYNKNGMLISTKSGEDNITAYTYDVFGNTASEITNGVTNAYTYDVNGNRNSFEQKEGTNTLISSSYTYDSLDRLTGVDFGDVSAAYTYDANNRLLTDSRGNRTSTYTYNKAGLVTALQNSSGDMYNYSYTYRLDGKQLTKFDGDDEDIYTYNDLGQLIGESINNTDILYTYDTRGNRIEMYENDKYYTTEYGYDKNNRLYQVKDSESSEAASYEYYMNGAQKKVTNANGSRANFEYNADGTLSQLTNRTSNGTIIDDYTYTYDAAKNQISKTEILNGQNKGTTSYTYDSVNRLRSVTEPSDKLTQYTYDKADNRKTETVVENSVTSTTTYSYNDQERLMKTIQAVGGTTKTVSYNYDYNGNVYSKTQGVSSTDSGEEAETAMNLLGIDDTTDCAEIYEYDVFNQLVKTYKGSNVITNVYNGEGHRVSKTSNGVTTNYLYEYDRVILETDGNNNQTARNIYGTNLISRESNNTKYTYHYNGHGDVTSLTDQTGTVAASYDYDPFGNMIDKTGDVDNPFRYSGYEFDDETNLYYLKSRFYNSETARFMQEDTYRGDPSDPLSLNLYTYVCNNPNTYTDWFGFFGTTNYNPENPFLIMYMSDKEGRYADDKNGYTVDVEYIQGNKKRVIKQYSIEDMNALLELTGGNVNIILSVRDCDFGTDNYSENTIAGSYAYMIALAMESSEALGKAMPSFFLGTPHFEPNEVNTKDYATSVTNIINGVKLELNDDSMIAGVYYGREDPDNVFTDSKSYAIMKSISEYTHDNGGNIVWIPYMTNETEMKNVGYVANTQTYTAENGMLYNLMDVVLLQPGYFYPEIGSSQDEYFEQKLQDIYNSILYRRIIVNNQEVGGAKTTSTIIGLQYEFDSSWMTGRWHFNQAWQGNSRGTLPEKKRANFAEYINRFYALVTGRIDGYRRSYGMYAGGPNEMNLRNPKSTNTNYIGTMYDSKGNTRDSFNINSVYLVGNSYEDNLKYEDLSIDQFTTYKWNAIWDAMNGLINDDWRKEFLDFINNR